MKNNAETSIKKKKQISMPNKNEFTQSWLHIKFS